MREINLYGPVISNGIEDGMLSPDSVAASMKDVDDKDPVKFFVSSPGGSVFGGLSIYQRLVRREGENHFVLEGVAASISSIIPMAGDTITMGQSSRIMVHNPMGPSSIAFGTSDDLREAAEDTVKTADLLDSVRDTLVDIYVARTGASKGDLLEMMEAETWLTAKDAVKMGFADKVLPNKTIAACQWRDGHALPMKDVDELIATAELCERVAIRNRREQDTTLLDRARRRMRLTAAADSI